MSGISGVFKSGESPLQQLKLARSDSMTLLDRTVYSLSWAAIYSLILIMSQNEIAYVLESEGISAENKKGLPLPCSVLLSV